MSPALASWFGTPGHVSAAQECARAVIIFIYGVIAVRLAGRQIFAAWAAPDIIVAIIFGSTLSRALTGTRPRWAKRRTFDVSRLLLQCNISTNRRKIAAFERNPR